LEALPLDPEPQLSGRIPGAVHELPIHPVVRKGKDFMIEIDDQDQIEQLEARGFHLCGLVVFNPASKQIGILWAVSGDEQERILRSLQGGPDGWRSLNVVQ
jgi:hypothetical protein